MPFIDMPLEQMRSYRPAPTARADFDAFWARTLEETRFHPLDARFALIDTGLATVESFDASFAGSGGTPIKAWFTRPAGAKGRLPCVIEFVGYGGGRGLPWDHLFWASAGFAHLVMDTRGQGSSWSPGSTADADESAGDASVPGLMTRGIRSPERYYYKRTYMDAVRAVEAALTRPDVDPKRIAVTGGSQGGGLAIACAALSATPRLCMPDVPFLCDFSRAVELCDTDPFSEIRRYLAVHRDEVELAFATLSYFDCANLAPRAGAKALFSIALMDAICPPSTCFAAYNAYGGEKELLTYRFNNHEGGGSFHAKAKLDFARREFL
jgi:cephalosporin-C deacetylase